MQSINFWESVQGSVKIFIALKKVVRKPSILPKTRCQLQKKKKKKGSDVPHTNGNLIKKQRRSYCEISANNADSIEKIRISKTHDKTRKKMYQEII